MKKYVGGLLALSLVLGLMSGCGKQAESATTAAAETEPIETQIVYTPAGTASGSPGSPDCKAQYVGEPFDPSAVVATAGEKSLTVGQLQIWYQLAAGNAGLDLSIPLFAQSYDSTHSWEQQLLKEAVNAWYQSVIWGVASKEPQIITEPGYTPAPVQADYVDETKPVWNVLYRNRDCYTPNSVHQAFLDTGLEETLEALAKKNGYAGTDAMAKDLFSCDKAALLEEAKALNFAYMYFTEKSYDFKPTEEELNAYLAANPGTNSDHDLYVDLRQGLFIPDGAVKAPDGTITASEGSWAALQTEVEETLEVWHSHYLNAKFGPAFFANVMNKLSSDQATALDGGQLNKVVKGQLIAPLDAWVFDSARQPGDYTIIRTPYGLSTVYYWRSFTGPQEAARQALAAEALQEIIAPTQEATPLEADYSKVSLLDFQEKNTISLDEVLYSDIGHQRFPEPMVYFQQDYYTVKFANHPLHTTGCGITTFAMAATYLGDSIYTPYQCAEAYPEYAAGGGHGTNGQIFEQVTPDCNFYCDQQVYEWPQVVEALSEGRVAVSLQHKGHFTSSGHYLLLYKLTEDGNVVVRDSNLYNYGKKPGHKIDAFTPYNVYAASGLYWTFQPKIITIPACARCGGEEHSYALQEDYICRKCLSALERRNDFVDFLTNI